MTHRIKPRMSTFQCFFMADFDIVGGEIKFGNVSVDAGGKKRKIATIFTLVTHIWVTKRMVVKLLPKIVYLIRPPLLFALMTHKL